MYVHTFLSECGGKQIVYEVHHNQLTLEFLKLTKFMIQHGFYRSREELRGIVEPLIKILNGTLDVYDDESAKTQLSLPQVAGSD